MIIPFLRSLYYPQPTAHDSQYSQLEDQELCAEIRKHGIGAQVYHLLKSMTGKQVKVTSTFRELLYRSYETSFMQNLLIKRETDLLLKGRSSRQAPDIDGMVYITSGQANIGDIVRLKITDSSDYDLIGEMVES